jgi:hypothetical protein
MFIVFLIFLSCFYHNKKTSRRLLPEFLGQSVLYLSEKDIINHIGCDVRSYHLRFHWLALRGIV